MKRLLLSSAVVVGIAATSWADAPATEPIAGGTATPNPGSENPPKDPFQPYDVGPGVPWTYNNLTAAEKAVVDKSRDTAAWVPVHAAYNTAVAEQAQYAAARSAASQLGVNDLALTGVVP